MESKKIYLKQDDDWEHSSDKDNNKTKKTGFSHADSTTKALFVSSNRILPLATAALRSQHCCELSNYAIVDVRLPLLLAF